VAKALVLAWCEVLTVAAIAVFFSSFSSPFLSGTFALALWADRAADPRPAGRDRVERVDLDRRGVAKGHADHRPRPARVLDLGRRRRRPARLASTPTSSTGATSRPRRSHGALWIAALLVLACAIFRKRDFV
jgi:hypothetical protein